MSDVEHTGRSKRATCDVRYAAEKADSDGRPDAVDQSGEVVDTER